MWIRFAAGEIAVSASIIEYDDPAEATRALKDAKSQLKAEAQETSLNRGRKIKLIKEESSHLGDESFVLDMRGSDAFLCKKGSRLVQVNVIRPVQANDVYLGKKFAELVASSLEP